MFLLLFFEMGSHSVALVGLELDNVDQAGLRLNRDTPVSASQMMGLSVHFKSDL